MMWQQLFVIYANDIPNNMRMAHQFVSCIILYSNGRTHTIKVNDVRSKLTNVQIVVPLESMLRQQLFVIYVNNLPNNILMTYQFVRMQLKFC